MDRVPLQEWLSKPGLVYGLFKGFVCSSVLLSFRSIWFSFELKNKLCLLFVLFPGCWLVFIWREINGLIKMRWVFGIAVSLFCVVFGFGIVVTVLFRSMTVMWICLCTGR